MVPKVLQAHMHALTELCRALGVRRLDLFGSATTPAFDEVSSDLDFVVVFDDEVFGTLADRYMDLAEGLEALLGRPVDLITERSIRNPVFRRAVELTHQRVYDRESAQTPA